MRKDIWLLNHYALPPDLPGGTRHFDLACELTEIRYDVTIIASAFNHKLRQEMRLQNGEDWRVERIADINFVWVKTFPYRANSWRRVLNMISFMIKAYLIGRKLPKKQRIDSPDIIVGSSVHLLTVLTAYLLSRHFKTQFVMEVRDLWPQTLVDMGMLSENSVLTKSMRWLEKFLYKKAERIVVLLPKANEYITSLGIQASKIHWIPNGVNLARVPKQYPDTLPDKPFTVMYVGAHGQANALKVVLDAAAVVLSRGYLHIHFIFVGDGPMKPELVAYKRAKQIVNTEFRDPVAKSKIGAILQKSSALVLALKDSPLYNYGISLNKLFDYLAASKPVILAGNPINNIVKDAQCGLTVPPEDPGALADAVIHLYKTPLEQRQAMGARGRAHVEQYYDMKVLAGRFHHMFEELIVENSERH